MPVYERETVVRAPLSAVRAFHVRIEGLTAVTPDWFGLRVDGVDPPDGATGPELPTGTRVHLSVRPLGHGPRLHWTSVIRENVERAGEAVFRDEMVEGPFPRWVHTHRFVALDDPAPDTPGGTTVGPATRVRDTVDYRLPGGLLGRAAGPLAVVGLAPTFRYRHRRTRQLLEGGAGATAGDAHTGGDA